MPQVFVSKRTGKQVTATPLVVGFSNRRADMFRLMHTNGRVTSVDRDSIRRRYTAA